jgi:hypothetical protein
MTVLTDRNPSDIRKDRPSCVISRISGREHNSVAVGILGDHSHDLIDFEFTEGTRVPEDNIFHDATLCYWYEYCQ